MSTKLPLFFYEIFDPSLPRLGPGGDDLTVQALDMVFGTLQRYAGPPDPAMLRIVDIGCGTGAQTIQVAKYTGATVEAVDNHQPYLDELMRRATAAGLSAKINTRLGDMHSPEVDPESLDIVWAEGCLFVMGFTNGLATCHEVLKPGGFLAASELSWLSADPPPECREFFAGEYPAMTGIEANLDSIRCAGYEVIGHFIQPESAWWESYYLPLEHRLSSLRKRCVGDAGRMDMIESVQREIDIFRKYSRHYSNVFYVMQKQ